KCFRLRTELPFYETVDRLSPCQGIRPIKPKLSDTWWVVKSKTFFLVERPKKESLCFRSKTSRCENSENQSQSLKISASRSVPERFWGLAGSWVQAAQNY